MTTTLLPFPKKPPGKGLDTLIQDLCDAHGINAVGASLTRIYGRTQAMQAVLGYLPETEPPSEDD
ncbi:MAG: hypothetical protein AAGE59_37335 [Cyanobacteria bacterium P01_F01_bin.86]